MSFLGLGNGADRGFLCHYSPTKSASLKKTRFYVWFLGNKQCHGACGRDFVFPIVRQLIEENYDCPPPCKVTVQVSEKGVKICQNVPRLSRRTGKLKMDVIRLIVPPQSITYSCIGPAPYNDVVSCVLFLWNPNTKCPVQVHVYRCDSPETASIMHSSMQILIDRPENQRALLDAEKRLMSRGLLIMKNIDQQSKIDQQTNSQFREYEIPFDHYKKIDIDRSNLIGNSTIHERDSAIFPNQQKGPFPSGPFHNQEKGPFPSGPFPLGPFPNQQDRSPNQGPNQNHGQNRSKMSPILESDECEKSSLHKALFSELKSKLQSRGPLLLPPKDYPSKIDPIDRLDKKINAINFTPTQTFELSATQNGLVQKNFYKSNEESIQNRSMQNQSIDYSPSSNFTLDRKNRFEDEARQKFAQNGENFEQMDRRRLATSSSNLFANVGAQNCVSCDGNWLIRKPRSLSLQNLCGDCDLIDDNYNRFFVDYNRYRLSADQNHNHRLSDERNRYFNSDRYFNPAVINGKFSRHFYQPVPNCHPNSRGLFCDPFGRKYERRMTVDRFWRDAPTPTKIEDNYGSWYVTPFDDHFP